MDRNSEHTDRASSFPAISNRRDQDDAHVHAVLAESRHILASARAARGNRQPVLAIEGSGGRDRTSPAGSRASQLAEVTTADIIAELRLHRAYLDAIEENGRPAEKGGPFATLGEELIHVARASIASHPGAASSRSLLAAVEHRAAPAGAGEQVPADGGFLVQPEFSRDLANKVYDTGVLLSVMDRRTTTRDWSSGLKLPGFDEQSRADGSRFGGVRGYWANEADAVNATKAKYRAVELSLKKLLGFSSVTDELLADGALLGQAIQTAFAGEFVFKLEDAAVNGDGAGKPLGVMNCGALITVSKQAGQASGTIVAQNLADMNARCWGPSRRRAVWLVHPDAEEQILQAVIAAGAAGAPPQWFHFSEDDDEPNRIFGRPVYVSEYCQAVGTPGDVVLFDPAEYIFLEKVGGPAAALSMHVQFVESQQVFRFTWRCDGAPKWHVPVTPKTGTKTLSPYVCLAQR